MNPPHLFARLPTLAPHLPADLPTEASALAAHLLARAAAGDCALLPLATWAMVEELRTQAPSSPPEIAPDPTLPPFLAAIRQAQAQIQAHVAARCPEQGPIFAQWCRGLTHGAPPEAYFTHPDAFPTLWLPWSLEVSLGGPGHVGLIRSSMAGYYAIRVMDNLMDGDATIEAALLPTLRPLMELFLDAYRTALPDHTEFWALFDQIWTRSTEATIVDAALRDLDEATYLDVSARKVEAALIPLAAVCHLNGRSHHVPQWSTWVARYGAWHQFANDLRDWQRDLRGGRLTLLLAEGQRRRAPDESVELWVFREGHQWATERLDAWMADCEAMAAPLGCPAVLDFLQRRHQTELERRALAQPGLDLAAQLLRAFAIKPA